MIEIRDVDAWEVLDSRGNPTVRAAVTVDGGRGVFTVPAGASTGTHEVVERRDGGNRYGGGGVREAVVAAREVLAPVVVGRNAADQRAIDAVLVECDGTENLSNLGGNAVLAVSGAVANATAAARNRPLYRTLRDGTPRAIPRPMVNVLSGGLHAKGGIEIQDFLVVPVGATTYSEALETVWAVRDAVRERIEASGERPLVADEGGFSPPFSTSEDAFELLETAVRDAGHEPSRDDVAFAIDVAATHFYDAGAGTYALSSLDRTLDREGMISLVTEWAERYPVVSLEDPLAEDDWEGWVKLCERLDGVQLLGDDLLVTDGTRIERAAASSAATAALIKLNQAGTISRTLDGIKAARNGGIEIVVSARSGETCDTTIADLAVAVDAGQIKIGSLARSERLAKYNRLLGIDRELDTQLADKPSP